MLKAAAQSAALVVFALVVLFLGFVLFRTLFPSAQPIEQESTEQPQQYDAGKDGNRKIAESFWQRPTNDPVAFFTLWIAAFTALLVVVSAFQIGFLIRADDTAATAANAAKKSAEAASDSVKAFVRSERGRLLIGTIKLSGENDGRQRIDYTWINIGRVPVVITDVLVDCQMFDEIPDVPVYDNAKIRRGQSFLGSGASAGSIGEGPKFKPLEPCITSGDWTAIAANQKRILFYGFIRYQDAFHKYCWNFGSIYMSAEKFFSTFSLPASYNEEIQEE